MTILLWGEDNFRSLRKLEEIVEHYRKKTKAGFNLKTFDFEKNKDRFEDLRDQFQTRSFFPEKKLFIVRNAFSNPDFKEKFLAWGKKFLDESSVIVFYQREKVKAQDPLFLFLKRKGLSERFDPLKGVDLSRWLDRELSRYEAKIESRAKALLLGASQGDLWFLNNEIKKLVSYQGAFKNSSQEITISLRAVEFLTPLKIEPKIFTTIDLISQGKKDKALLLLHQHLQKGDNGLYLLSMITFQFRKILILKDWVLRGRPIWQLKWHPFLIKKTSQLAQGFDLSRLKEIYFKIGKMDLEIKRGQIDPELALDLFVSQLPLR